MNLKKRLLCASLAVLMTLSGFVIFRSEGAIYAADASDFKNNSTVKKYNKEIESLNEQQKEIKNKISKLKNEKNSLLEEKEYYDKLVESYDSKIEMQELLIKELEAEIEQLGVDIESGEKTCSETYEDIKTRIRVSYESGESTYLEMILGASSLTDFLIGLDNAVSMLEYDRRMLLDYKTAVEDLELRKATVEADREAMIAVKADLEASKKESEELSEKSATMLADALSDISLQQSTLKEIEAAEEKANKKLEAFIDDLIKQQGVTQVVAEGEYMWPLPTKYTHITSYFGNRADPFTGKPSNHGGTDIYAPKGTKIYASNNGTVVRAEKDASYGNYVMIDHGGGVFSIYAHCSKLLVTNGTYVKKGTVIAEVGSTGHSTGNHLHFEFRNGKTKVDALKYVTIPK